MDVMDGNFVPNLTFGPGYINKVKDHTSIPLDIHLMIEKPENSITQYIDTRPWAVTIHYESTRFPARILTMIREAGIIAGLSINPATPIETTFDLLPYTDMLLIMSVDPGFFGQSFMPIALKKLEKLSEHKKVNGLKDLRIQIDGGINRNNIADVTRAGAGIIVAGSSAFKDGNVNKNVLELKQLASA